MSIETTFFIFYFDWCTCGYSSSNMLEDYWTLQITNSLE